MSIGSPSVKGNNCRWKASFLVAENEVHFTRALQYQGKLQKRRVVSWDVSHLAARVKLKTMMCP